MLNKVREMTDESITLLQQLALQKAKTFNDQANIVIAANSFLFLPFVSCFTGARELTGLLVSVPIVICGVGIFLNAGFIWYIYTAKKDIELYNKTIKELMTSYDKAFESYKGLPRLSDFFTSLFDFFKKYAPIVLLVTWCLCLSIVIAQLSLDITI
jgi:hypothetical protein